MFHPGVKRSLQATPFSFPTSRQTTATSVGGLNPTVSAAPAATLQSSPPEYNARRSHSNRGRLCRLSAVSPRSLYTSTPLHRHPRPLPSFHNTHGSTAPSAPSPKCTQLHPPTHSPRLPDDATAGHPIILTRTLPTRSCAAVNPALCWHGCLSGVSALVHGQPRV